MKKSMFFTTIRVKIPSACVHVKVLVDPNVVE